MKESNAKSHSFEVFLENISNLTNQIGLQQVGHSQTIMALERFRNTHWQKKVYLQ